MRAGADKLQAAAGSHSALPSTPARPRLYDLGEEMVTPEAQTGQSTAPPAAATRPSANTPHHARTPAATAAGRAFAASLLLGLLALASTIVVVARLVESWRVAPGPASHAISFLGQRLSYPTANGGAIVVTALAGLGLLMAAAAGWRAARELLAYRAFRRIIATRSPRALDGAWLIEDDRPLAFCAGLLRPRVYVSTAAIGLLHPPALGAVLAHERQHARRHDPLRLVCCRILVAALFFIPRVSRLAQRQQALAELGADEAAMLSRGGDGSALANAMLSLSRAGGTDAPAIDPERVDHLLGERIRWCLPLTVCFGATVALSVLIALSLLAGQAAAGTATLAPPFLSGRPCVSVLAMIPAAGAVATWALGRARRAPRPVASRR